MTLEVDASVAFKWFAQEDGTDRALMLLEREEPIVAPDLIVAEICNAAWKSLRRGELSPAQFDAIVNDVAQPFFRLVPLDQLIRPAAALTRRLDHPIHDCLYLALAGTEGLRSSPPTSACSLPSRVRLWPARSCGSERSASSVPGGSIAPLRASRAMPRLGVTLPVCCDARRRGRQH